MGSDSPRGKLTEQSEGSGSEVAGKLGWVAIAAGLLLAGALVWRSLGRTTASPRPSTSAAPAQSSASAPLRPPRCVDVAPSGGLTIGEQAAPKPTSGRGGAPSDDDGLPEEDPLAP